MLSVPKRNVRNASLTVAGLAIAGLAVLIYQGKRKPVGIPQYVALGSSFAAGIGLGKRAPGSPYVCFRSVNGYPQQLARLLGLSLVDVTCSNATTDQVLRGGQFFQPGQIHAITSATELVTLTSGGNDVNYIGDLIQMSRRRSLIGTLTRLKSGEPKPVDQRAFQKFERDLALVLREVRRRAPNATIVIVTYPSVLPTTETCLALGITTDEANLMRLVANRLAESTRSVAEAEETLVVDMAELGKDDDACSADPWVNGPAPKAGAPFHPNLQGAAATAEAIAARLRS